MTLVDSLFEAHIAVTNLDTSIAFYRDVVGLELAHVTENRQAAFFWIGTRGRAMLGVWAAGSAPHHMIVHVAFTVTLESVLAAPRALRSLGVTPLDFVGMPTDEPVVIGWMPAASIYFRDPDGHLLEYLAMLPDVPRPECGIVSWHAWQVGDRYVDRNIHVE
jgi:lactoylglutathione lyase